jgi:hypothetical protein
LDKAVVFYLRTRPPEPPRSPRDRRRCSPAAADAAAAASSSSRPTRTRRPTKNRPDHPSPARVLSASRPHACPRGEAVGKGGQAGRPRHARAGSRVPSDRGEQTGGQAGRGRRGTASGQGAPRPKTCPLPRLERGGVGGRCCGLRSLRRQTGAGSALGFAAAVLRWPLPRETKSFSYCPCRRLGERERERGVRRGGQHCPSLSSTSPPVWFFTVLQFCSCSRSVGPAGILAQSAYARRRSLICLSPDFKKMLNLNKYSTPLRPFTMHSFLACFYRNN